MEIYQTVLMEIYQTVIMEMYQTVVMEMSQTVLMEIYQSYNGNESNSLMEMYQTVIMERLVDLSQQKIEKFFATACLVMWLHYLNLR